MDNQKEIKLISGCDHCSKEVSVLFECNHCLRMVCLKCVVTIENKQACMDCYFQVFGTDMPPMGETLYVILPSVAS